jgi:hypothetical protein
MPKVRKLICCACCTIVKASEGKQYDDLFICKECDGKRCKNYSPKTFYNNCASCRALPKEENIECNGKMPNCICEKLFRIS